MASVPKTFKLNNQTWSIVPATQEEIDKEMIDQGPTGSYRGFTDRQTYRIVYKKEQHKQDVPRTVLHETLHALLRTSGPSLMDHDTEEKVVVHLEDSLADLIKNNPKLIKYFQENL